MFKESQGLSIHFINEIDHAEKKLHSKLKGKQNKTKICDVVYNNSDIWLRYMSVPGFPPFETVFIVPESLTFDIRSASNNVSTKGKQVDNDTKQGS